MSAGHELVDASRLEKRSYGKMVLFFVVTFGFYGLYWIHQVNKQFANATDADFNPTTRTLGLFVPVYNLIVIWKMCQLAGSVVDDQDGTMLFLLYFLVAPVGVYVIQSGINSKAT